MILLAFVWDKTASWTTCLVTRLESSLVNKQVASWIERSNTEDRLLSWSAPPFIMGRDCLWDREEQHRGQTAQLISSSFITGQDCLWNSKEHNVCDQYHHVPGDLQEQTSWTKYLVIVPSTLFNMSILDRRKKITNIVFLAEAVLSHDEGTSSSAVHSSSVKILATILKK